ncbi:MAG: hypothetical protein HW404_369 [Anaerolineales bacterium]|nr:hypothetical protein [Anaerolineales bacterium]MBM2842532.1 hypothetical protein [Anaerolineales bacterium]
MTSLRRFFGGILGLLPSLADVLAIAGVGMIGVGLWWVYPPLALLTVGSLLLLVSLLHASGESASRGAATGERRER